MATKQENIQKDSWWINELDSLGVSVKVRNELNNIEETCSLAENLKHVFYQAYKNAYNDNDNNKIRPIFKWC
jgi:DNA repair ATPase RecN